MALRPRSVVPSSVRFDLRGFVLLMTGLMVFGLGVAFVRHAGLGLDPWSALHRGLQLRTPLSFGTASVLGGFLILAVGVLAFRQRVDRGTVLNMLLIGPWSDVFHARMPEAANWAAQPAYLLLGIGLIGLGSGMYVGARWGAGPRDGFVLAASAATGRSVRLLRTLVELSVLALGMLLGATAGVGTVAFALLIGPAAQAGLRLFGALPTRSATLPASP